MSEFMRVTIVLIFYFFLQSARIHFFKSNICSMCDDFTSVIDRETLGEGKLSNLLYNTLSALAGTKGVCTSSTIANASSNLKTLSPSSCASSSIYIVLRFMFNRKFMIGVSFMRACI